MKYERITKIGNDAFKYGEYQGKYTVDKGDIIQLCTKYDCAYGGKAIDRLAELENKIESGELVFKKAIIEEPNTLCLHHDKFFDIVTQVSKHGQVVTPIKED